MGAIFRAILPLMLRRDRERLTAIMPRASLEFELPQQVHCRRHAYRRFASIGEDYEMGEFP